VSKVVGNFIMESKNFQTPANSRQAMEIMRCFALAWNKANPTFDQVEKLVKDPSPIYDFFSKEFGKKFDDNKNSRQIKAIWQKIYKQWFNLEKDFSAFKVPENYDPKKHFAVIVSQGLTMNEIIVAMRKKFKVYLYTENLDENVNQNDRTLEGGDYIVLFNRNVEADKEFKNISANQLKTMSHKGITLMERLLLEVFYFNETKKHLDIDNVTLCSGSRCSGGYVPHVHWDSDGDEVNVYWYDSDDSDDNLRSRAVVS